MREDIIVTKSHVVFTKICKEIIKDYTNTYVMQMMLSDVPYPLIDWHKIQNIDINDKDKVYGYEYEIICKLLDNNDNCQNENHYILGYELGR